MEMLKTLWYVRKARIYEALVQKMMGVRAAAKDKQQGFRVKASIYRELVRERTNVT